MFLIMMSNVFILLHIAFQAMTFVWVSMPHVSADIMGVLHNHIAILTPAWILNKRADNFGFSFRDQRLQPGLQPIPLAGIRAFGKQLVYVANQVDSLFGFGSWLANSVSHKHLPYS
jgi:hypothetical protein